MDATPTQPSPASGPAYLRVRDIVRPHGVLPISRSTWYAWLALGKAPAGIRLSPRIVVWPQAVVLALVGV